MNVSFHTFNFWFMNCPKANHISHNHLLSNFHKLVLVCSSIAHSALLLIIIINWCLHWPVQLTCRWQNIAFFPNRMITTCRPELPLKAVSLTVENLSAVCPAKLLKLTCIQQINSSTVTKHKGRPDVLSQAGHQQLAKQQEVAVPQPGMAGSRAAPLQPPAAATAPPSLQSRLSESSYTSCTAASATAS